MFAREDPFALFSVDSGVQFELGVQSVQLDRLELFPLINEMPTRYL